MSSSSSLHHHHDEKWYSPSNSSRSSACPQWTPDEVTRSRLQNHFAVMIMVKIMMMMRVMIVKVLLMRMVANVIMTMILATKWLYKWSSTILRLHASCCCFNQVSGIDVDGNTAVILMTVMVLTFWSQTSTSQRYAFAYGWGTRFHCNTLNFQPMPEIFSYTPRPLSPPKSNQRGKIL